MRDKLMRWFSSFQPLPCSSCYGVYRRSSRHWRQGQHQPDYSQPQRFAILAASVLLDVVLVIFVVLMLVAFMLYLDPLATAQNQTSSKQITLQVRPHSVSLSWIASTTPDVTYNVYRSTVKGGPYAKISKISVAGTSYIDQPVPGSTTFYYVVTAVDSGHESAYSAEVAAIVP